MVVVVFRFAVVMVVRCAVVVVVRFAVVMVDMPAFAKTSAVEEGVKKLYKGV